ncbi:MAG: ABC transporter permease [Verrucomicrobiota bacterium]|nr:ABC transporter permease [Verrucomicrobiota bacterium]
MKQRIHHILWQPETFLALLVASLFGLMGQLDPAFIQWHVQRELSTHAWELAIIAIPMTLVILTGGIDLSVGAIMSLTAITLGMLFQSGCPLPLACLAALLAGILCGALNGWFITRMQVHPLIITLATMAAYRGVAEGISRARPVSGFPSSFAWLGQGLWLGIPVAGWLFLGLLVVMLWMMHARSFGTHVYAIGLNSTATRFSGIRVDRMLLAIYTFSGGVSALAAILLVARRNTAKADMGMGMELGVITAVVIGGVSIFGGRGSLLGTCLGILLIHETREFVSWHWNRDELNLLALGALLILSVVFQKLLRHKRATP